MTTEARPGPSSASDADSGDGAAETGSPVAERADGPGPADDAASANEPAPAAHIGGNRAQLRLQFPTSEEARTVAAALAPDNEGHVTTRVEGTALILAADSDSFMGLLRSIDDVLGCVRALGHD